MANGDWIRTCFQCTYPGYTGGLVIGSLNGPGMGFYPIEPIRGYRSINVFCAQDESLWDRDEGAEYTYGWSENFGSHAPSRRLEYKRGRIIEGGPERVVLESENQGGCYRVTKVATTRATSRYWILATRITNVCDHPVHFDFFTGDDPWLGRYSSSDGDVGWTPEGIVDREASIAAFTAGGIYDLGNAALGQTDTGFSNQADFLALDPAIPHPDRAYIANRFAHDDKDIDPSHVLTNTAMIALNLGWKRRTLAPMESLSVAVAAGIAETGTPGTTPRVPDIPLDDWSLWRTYLRDGKARARGAPPLEFAAEDVEVKVGGGALAVTGVYYVLNGDDDGMTARIHYPVLVNEKQGAPIKIDVDGRALSANADGSFGAAVEFPIEVPRRGFARFKVHYEQPIFGREATYVVTSARSWPSPVARAHFTIRYPEGLGAVATSYPSVSRKRLGAEIVETIALHEFVPNRELSIRW